jgi:RNA polymerase sigma factor (sigma-70 family)
VEASALQAPVGLARISLSAPLLRLRSDDQLVALFRAGNDEAFRIIHDRYEQRLFAYARQMLSGSRQDAEDAIQDVFIRAHASLRSTDRPIALKAWLYRVAHNRCVDQIRRPMAPVADLWDVSRGPLTDPLTETERRDDLKRLVEDVRRLPEQQRSVLLMRELEGLSYADLAEALEVSVPAVKSLLVRARMGLVEAAEARDTACSEIRHDLTLAHGRGVRATGRARRHLRDCAGCREYRRDLRRVQRSFASLVPVAAGPLGLLAKLGIGGGGAGGGAGAATGGGAVAGGGMAAGGGVAASGTIAGTGAAALSATKVAAVVSAVVVAGGGAVTVEQTLVEPPRFQPTVTAVAPRVARPVDVRDTAAHAVDAPAHVTPAPAVVAPATGDQTAVPATQAPTDPTAIAPADDTANGHGGLAAPDDRPANGTAPDTPAPRDSLAPGANVTPPIDAGRPGSSPGGSARTSPGSGSAAAAGSAPSSSGSSAGTGTAPGGH